MYTDSEVLSDHGEDSRGPGRLLVIQTDKTFEKSSDKEADHCRIKYRPDSQSGIKNTSKKRRDQGGDGRHLIDDGISFYNILPGKHLRDAGLHGGRFKGSKHREDDKQRSDDRYVLSGRRGEACNEDGQSGESVQSYHDIAPVGPVGKNTAERRQQDGRNHGQCQKSCKDRSGAGALQHIHGQGKLQRIISNQGTDLPCNQKDKIAGKKFLFHSKLYSFQFVFESFRGRYICRRLYLRYRTMVCKIGKKNTVFLIPSERMYIIYKNRVP